jgi:hypothetical protein
MRIQLLLAASSLAFAGSRFESPSLGYVRTGAGLVTRLSGVAAAMIPEATGESEAETVAFSGKLLVEKLRSSVRVLDESGALVSVAEAPEGWAVIGFDESGASAALWLAQSSELRVFRSGAWAIVPFEAGRTAGSVMAVRVEESGSVTLLVSRGGIWLLTVRTSDGAIESESPAGAAAGPALFVRGGGLLFQRDDLLVHRTPAGDEQTIDLPEPAASLNRMGLDWIQAGTTNGKNYAVRLRGTPRVYEIPEVER